MTELEKNNFQFNYFSENYKKFEEDYYKYSKINIPLTFLTDNILKHMVYTKNKYFRLNAENSSDNQDHYFVFDIVPANENNKIIKFEYVGHF